MSLALVKSLLQDNPVRRELTDRSISADEMSSFEIAMNLDGALTDACVNKGDTQQFQEQMLAYSRASIELQQEMLRTMNDTRDLQRNTMALLQQHQNSGPMLYEAPPELLPMFDGGGELMQDLLAPDPALDRALYDLDNVHEIYNQQPMADLTARSDRDPTDESCMELEPRSEQQAEARQEHHTEARQEHHTEPRQEQHTEPRQEQQIETRPEPQSEPQIEPQSEPQPAHKTKYRLEAQTKDRTEDRTEDRPKDPQQNAPKLESQDQPADEQVPEDVACGEARFSDFLTAYAQLAENGKIVPNATASVTCSKLGPGLQEILPGQMSKTNVLKGQKKFLAHVLGNVGVLAAFAVSDTHPVRSLSAGGGEKNRQYKLVGWALKNA